MPIMKLAAVAAVFGAGLTLGGIAIATDGGPPPPPEWVNPNGTMNPEKAPEYMPVVDGSGDHVGFARFTELHAAPDAPPGAVPPREKPVKVFSDRNGNNHVGWVVPGRGYQAGTAEPRP